MNDLFADMESKNLISFERNPNCAIFAKSNSLENIADFLYILRYCEPVRQDSSYWTLRAYTMELNGGCKRQ